MAYTPTPPTSPNSAQLAQQAAYLCQNTQQYQEQHYHHQQQQQHQQHQHQQHQQHQHQHQHQHQQQQQRQCQRQEEQVPLPMFSNSFAAAAADYAAPQYALPIKNELSHNQSSLSPPLSSSLSPLPTPSTRSPAFPYGPLPPSQNLYLTLLHRTPPVKPFIYAVQTTHIYCVPGCPSRLARRNNIQFYSCPAAARAAGFRACKRCKPDESFLPFENPRWSVPGWNDYTNVQDVGDALGIMADSSATSTISSQARLCSGTSTSAGKGESDAAGAERRASSANSGSRSQGQSQPPRQQEGRLVLPAQKRQSEAVAKACELLREGRRNGGRLSVGDVAKEVGLTKWHFGRVFRRIMGVGPGEWARRLDERDVTGSHPSGDGGGGGGGGGATGESTNIGNSVDSGWIEINSSDKMEQAPTVRASGVVDKNFDFNANYDTPDSGTSSADNLWWRDMSGSDFVANNSITQRSTTIADHEGYVTPSTDDFDWNQFLELGQPGLSEEVMANIGGDTFSSVEFLD